MYDRKTWIVLAVCSVLLALGFVDQNKKQAAARAEKARQEQDAKARADAAKPATPTPETPAGPAAATAQAPAPDATPAQPEATETLQTPDAEFVFTNHGGGIKYAEVKHQLKADESGPVRVNAHSDAPIGALAGPDATLQNASYTYDAAASQPGKRLIYSATLANGLKVVKTYALGDVSKPGGAYLVDFTVRIENPGQAPFSLKDWSIYAGVAEPLHKNEEVRHTGAMTYDSDIMHLISPSGFKGGMISSAKSAIDSPAGQPLIFAGVTNQFISTVFHPKEPAPTSLWARPGPAAAGEHSIRAGLRFPEVTLNPSESRTFSYQIYIGPRHNAMLQKMGGDWDVLMPYTGPIARFFFIAPVARTLNWVLNFVHGLIDGFAGKWSWGWSIVLLTIVVRVAIWPLYARSTRTMKRMGKLKPEMEKLRAKYPDDPQKVNTETMALYRKYGVSPLGGCLPMFVQIPVFFGFYTMLQYSVELRHQQFLWVKDLSMPDTLGHAWGIPINILPVVMAISSFVQIRMTPQTGDRTQQKIIMFMPFMFFFFCYNFASALALYWTTTNIFSIGQTWLMNRLPEPDLVARKGAAAKKGWFQRKMEEAVEAQKKRQREGGQGGGSDSAKKRPPRTGG